MIIGLCSDLEKGGFYWHLRHLKELLKHSQVCIDPVKRLNMLCSRLCVCLRMLVDKYFFYCLRLSLPISNFCQMPGQWFVEMCNEQDQEPHPNDELHFFSSLTIFGTYPFPNVDYHMAVYVLIQKHLRTQLRSKKKMQKVRGYCSNQCCLHFFSYIHRGSEFPSMLKLVKIPWQHVCSIISTNKESS